MDFSGLLDTIKSGEIKINVDINRQSITNLSIYLALALMLVIAFYFIVKSKLA